MQNARRSRKLPLTTGEGNPDWEPDQSKHSLYCAMQGSHSSGQGRRGQCDCGRDALLAECSRLREQLDARERELRLAREDIRVREQSQIPMIPRAAKERMDKAEDRVSALTGALEEIVSRPHEPKWRKVAIARAVLAATTPDTPPKDSGGAPSENEGRAGGDA